MGFHSFKTNDTGTSVSNVYASQGSLEVYLKDNQGNVWHEPHYQGYGDFGGKDFYELLAEMNGLGSDRSKGIAMVYDPGRRDQIIWPNIDEDRSIDWRNEEPKQCEFQGYFY
jgi:hypothetical protein